MQELHRHAIALSIMLPICGIIVLNWFNNLHNTDEISTEINEMHTLSRQQTNIRKLQTKNPQNSVKPTTFDKPIFENNWKRSYMVVF